MAYKKGAYGEEEKLMPNYYKGTIDAQGKAESAYPEKAGNAVPREKGKGTLKLIIAILLILLIFISALFFVKNRDLASSKKEAEADKLDAEQALIRVLLKTPDSIIKEISIMNTGDKEEAFKVESAGISDIARILNAEFTIKPGQTGTVKINFSTFDVKNNIEYAPGVYTGRIIAKSEGFESEMPVIAEIETREVLFDANLNPVSADRKMLQGSDAQIEVRLFNLQSAEETNVSMDYLIKDLNGNTAISEREIAAVETQASFFKTLKIPQNLEMGVYVFAAKASYGNSTGTSSYLFEVEGSEEKPRLGIIGLCRKEPLCWALSLIVLLLACAIGAYLYLFSRRKLQDKPFSYKLPEKKPEAQVSFAFQEKKEGKLKEFLRKLRERKYLKKEEVSRKKLWAEKEKLGLKAEEQRLSQLRILEQKRKEEWAKKAEEEKSKEEKIRLAMEERLRKKELERRRAFEEKEEKEKKLKEILDKQEKERLRLEKEAEKERRSLERKEKMRAFFGKLPWKKEKAGREEEKQIELEKDAEFKDLEKQIMELGRVFEEEGELKPKSKGFLHKIGLKKTKEKAFGKKGRIKEEESAKALEETKEYEKKPADREVKKGSRLFFKCHDLMGKSQIAFENGNMGKAKSLYSKARNVYIKCSYHERKEIYAPLTELYNKLS